MRLFVIYRSTGPDNDKDRPAFFSKQLCLLSFLRSAESSGQLGEVVFLNDGPLADDRLKLMNDSGEVIALPGVGKSRSLRAALSMLETKGWSDADTVYLAEDDYIFHPDAMLALATAVDAIPQASYFSLYDYPGDYRPIDPAAVGRAPRRWHNSIFFAGDRHWRSTMSTTHSFAARIGILRHDSWIHWLGSRSSDPMDFAAWLAIQGLGVYKLVHALGTGSGIPTNRSIARAVIHGLWSSPGSSPPRLLVSPMPSLATHVQSGYLAPGIDWEAVAADTAEWAGSRAEGVRHSRIASTAPPTTAAT